MQRHSPARGARSLNGLDPQDYLRDVLKCVADHPTNLIDELLPWNFAQTVQERRAA